MCESIFGHLHTNCTIVHKCTVEVYLLGNWMVMHACCLLPVIHIVQVPRMNFRYYYWLTNT